MITGQSKYIVYTHRKAADDAYHSTPLITDRLLETSAEQSCVNGFKKEKDVFKKKRE